MSQSHVQTVRAASIRVALATTAVVAAVYLAIAASVAAISTQNLTSQIDAGLRDTLSHISRGPAGPGGPGGGVGGGSGGDEGFRPPEKGPYTAPAIVWTIQPTGAVYSSDATAVLPAAYYGVSSPVTVTIGNDTVRLAGGTAPDGDHVVVAQTMAAVGQAQSTIILLEILQHSVNRPPREAKGCHRVLKLLGAQPIPAHQVLSGNMHARD